MHDDDQGSWPVKVHPDVTEEPDTTTPPASSDKPAARRRVDSPVTHGPVLKRLSSKNQQAPQNQQ